MIAEFLKLWLPEGAEAVVSDPTWGNHNSIFAKAGFKVGKYRYYHPPTRGLDFKGMLEDLDRLKPYTVVLLHSCAHNPTGVDPTPEQWDELAHLFKAKRLFPFFDSAYQGYASGNLDRDAYSIRKFAEVGLELALTQSYAKNIGLYGERIGACFLLTAGGEIAGRVRSQLLTVIRPMYSSPPLHGALIVKKILGNRELYEEWKAELKGMADRVIRMRKLLFEALQANGISLTLRSVRFAPCASLTCDAGTPGTWNHIVDQIGMFTFTGLSPEQCEVLTSKYHIYLLNTGRISMAGLSEKRIKYFADAVKDVVLNVPAKL